MSTFKIRGVSFHKQAVNSVDERDKVFIRSDKTDKDPEGNALGIYTKGDALLGYVGADDKNDIKRLIKNKYKAVISTKTVWEHADGSAAPTGLKVLIVPE